MKLFQRIECWYMLGSVAFLAGCFLPPVWPYLNGSLGVIWLTVGCVLLCWIPLSFIFHWILRGKLTLRRHIWLVALITALTAVMTVVSLTAPEIVGSIGGVGLAAMPFLYLFICISETFIPWLDRARVKAFIKDLAV